VGGGEEKGGDDPHFVRSFDPAVSEPPKALWRGLGFFGRGEKEEEEKGGWRVRCLSRPSLMNVPSL